MPILVLAPLAFTLSWSLVAAPRPAYGGSAMGMLWGMPIELDPREGSTFADATVSGAIYETLYAIDEKGNLAPALAKELPRLDGNQLIVPLREGVSFHDGRPLTPEAAARWLRGLSSEPTRASYVVFGVKKIDARPDAGAVAFTLSEPYLDYARLLSSPHAAIGAASEKPVGLILGTGPWHVAASSPDSLSLEPFLGHRDGRPFLDAIAFRTSASRFETLTEAKKGEAALVFGVPDLKTTKRHESVAWEKGAFADELVLLAVGRQIEALRTQEAQRGISAALNRGVLARRYLGQGAEPASTLFGAEGRSGEPSPARARIDATLLVSKDDRVLHRIAERVQLDLLRAGVTVVIDQVPAKTLDARRRDGRYDLLLASTFPAWPGGQRPIDRYHALLSIAGWAGSLGTAITGAEHASFVHAPEAEQASALPDLEEAMRIRSGLVPIATRKPALAVRSDLKGWTLRPFGRLDLADASFPSPPRP